MKDFLEKIKLIDHLQTELEIHKNDFVTRLIEHVDQGSIGLFSDTFDIFSSSKNEYKGEVTFAGFKIKRRRRFFDMNMSMAVAKGTYNQQGSKLIINTEINSFHGIMIPIYIFLILVYGFFLFGILLADEIGGNAPQGFALPFIFIHAAFMMGIPYFIMRRSTKKLKHELEREFFYLTK